MVATKYSPEAIAAAEAGIEAYEGLQADRIFGEFLDKLAETPAWAALIKDQQVMIVLRHAFEVGMERGISKRGCCEGDE